MSEDHWVSRFLFKPFLTKGQVWAYNKANQRRIRRPVKKICCEEGFTTFPNDQMPQDIDGRFFETELSKWENQQSRIINKLIRGRTIDAINPEEFWELVRFAVWLHACNPANRAMLQQGWKDIHLAKAKLLSGDELDKISLQQYGILLPHHFLRNQVEKACGEQKLLQSEFLGMMLNSAETGFKLVSNEYSWILADYKNIDSVLCTSDRPVLLATDTLEAPVGYGTPQASLYFTLSPDLCLMGRNTGKAKRFIKKREIVSNQAFVVALNTLMWTKSSQYIIASKDSALPAPGTHIPSYTPKMFYKGNAMGFLQR